MAFAYSVASRNAALDALVGNWGATPTLKIWSGSAPSTAAAADTGTLTLATMTLPGTFMNTAASASKTLTGTWQDTSADSNGTASHFRIYQGATCVCQGGITATGGGGDMTLDNIVLASGQQITVTSFTLSIA